MVRVSLEDVDNDEDLLKYISDDSDDGDEQKLTAKIAEMEPPVEADTQFKRTVAVLGLPKVAPELLRKLHFVLQKKIAGELSKHLSTVTADSVAIDMPADEAGMSQGLGFLVFATEYEAQRASRALQGFQLDAKHKFTTSVVNQIESVVAHTETYVAPPPLGSFTREATRWWLEDERSRAQFLVRRDQETEIFWHEPGARTPTMVYNGQRERDEGRKVWTEFRVQWSPQGTFLATFHRPGIALWSGPNFEKNVRFEHREVKQMDFSPHETYAVTWDGAAPGSRNDKALRIWRVLTGTVLKAFPTPERAPSGLGNKYVAWSQDDKYCALIENEELHVYELPRMTLALDGDKKATPLKYPLEKCEWAPTCNTLALWTSGSIDTPGRLLLIDIPSRAELASKNVYSVGEASLHWQAEGRYLCLRAVVTRKTGKKGRKCLTQLEIFRLTEKDIPVDAITIEDLPVKQFHWEEGSSSRFAIVVRDELTQSQQIRMYQVSEAGTRRDTQLLCTMELLASMNYMKWGPLGTYFILASIERLGGAAQPSGNSAGALHFCQLTDTGNIEVLHKDEHYLVNCIRWSPCGRYLLSAVVTSMGVVTTNNLRLEQWVGYVIWTFQGKNQYRCNSEKLYQVAWRPAPPSLLKPSQLEDLKKNLKDYTRNFDERDERLRTEQRAKRDEGRSTVIREFAEVVDQLDHWLCAQDCYPSWKEAAEDFAAQNIWDRKELITEEEIEHREETLGP